MAVSYSISQIQIAIEGTEQVVCVYQSIGPCAFSVYVCVQVRALAQLKIIFVKASVNLKP